MVLIKCIQSQLKVVTDQFGGLHIELSHLVSLRRSILGLLIHILARQAVGGLKIVLVDLRDQFIFWTGLGVGRNIPVQSLLGLDADQLPSPVRFHIDEPAIKVPKHVSTEQPLRALTLEDDGPICIDDVAHLMEQINIPTINYLSLLVRLVRHNLVKFEDLHLICLLLDVDEHTRDVDVLNLLGANTVGLTLFRSLLAVIIHKEVIVFAVLMKVLLALVDAEEVCTDELHIRAALNDSKFFESFRVNDSYFVF